MNVEDGLIEFLNSRSRTKDDLMYLVDANMGTYEIDLDEVCEYSGELGAAIQRNFVDKWENICEVFETYSLNLIGRPLGISFFNASMRLPMRGLRSEVVGELITFRGIATRSSQVRPELWKGMFRCRDCGTKIGPVKQNHRYVEPMFCINELCSNRTKYEVDVRESEFVNWQRLNVQEDTCEIPDGCLPRTIDVVLRNDLVESVDPGSVVNFTGYCVPVPNDSMNSVVSEANTREGGVPEKRKRVAKDLSFKFVFFCIHATKNNVKGKNKTENELGSEKENNLKNRNNINISDYKTIDLDNFPSIDSLKIYNVDDLYVKLYSSLFPTIYGHANIKAAILLMLVGGVTKDVDGMRVRGDINVLLVGDPGTAKSQFLKHTAAVVPRAVYTSGKSSTAAGLTAAVVKDGETGEFAIEAGALMLADNGVCCIDEFDKMSYKDQVSIHEAMEQQTITIAKAGINATLNSRTSIIAAANPIRGRYDKKRNLRQNINLSAPIMSRFDLYFVLIDEISVESDRKIADAIISNHMHENLEKLDYDENSDKTNNHGNDNTYYDLDNLPFTVDQVVEYIKYVKHRKPVITEEAATLLRQKYVSLRQDSLINTSNYKMTPRHLESLIRLSEALAKIHNEPTVNVAHIEEAHRLIQSSVVEVCGDDINLRATSSTEDFIITSKDYRRITNCLIYLLKINNTTREEIIVKYLELIEDSISSIQQLQAERAKCENTIHYLIEKEGVLYEIDNILHIHPDYDC